MLDFAEMSGLAAVVCREIANGTRRIEYCERADPEDPADSGWQFTCGMDHGDDLGGAQIWSIGEVVEKEPSLKHLITKPVGTIIFRDDVHQRWQLKSI